MPIFDKGGNNQYNIIASYLDVGLNTSVIVVI